MYIIRPEIHQLEGIDEACLWALIMCFAKRANNETKFSFPSYQTIADDCGWGRRKAIYVVDKLVSLGIVIREARYRESGAQTSNNYTLNTDLVFVLTRLKSETTEVEELTTSEAENTPVQNLHPPRAKSAPLTRASIELTTTPTGAHEKNEKISELQSRISEPPYDQALARAGLDENQRLNLCIKVVNIHPDLPTERLLNKILSWSRHEFNPPPRQAPPPQKPEPTVNYDINAIHL